MLTSKSVYVACANVFSFSSFLQPPVISPDWENPPNEDPIWIEARKMVCCRALQDVAECCRMLQSVAECCRMLPRAVVCCSVLQCAAVCCSVSQCVAVCCSVLQCVAVCCSPLHCTRSNFLQSRYCCSVMQNVTVCCCVVAVCCCVVAVCCSPHTQITTKGGILAAPTCPAS